MYFSIINYLKNNYDYENIALCKESVEVWEKLRMDWENIKCNCLL